MKERKKTKRKVALVSSHSDNERDNGPLILASNEGSAVSELYERDRERNGIEYRINVLTEIDDSFESDYDKGTYKCGPKLILCDYCKNEHLLPAYE